MFPVPTDSILDHQEIDRPLYFRVDTPFLPSAISTSAYGSLVEVPPTDHPYRPVQWAVVDRELTNAITPTDTFDALNVEPWHEAGFKGQAVKIAVFDVEWQGAEWSNGELGTVTTHDCFAHPSCELPIDTLHPRFGFERGVHGVACAEVIEDIAPEADLHLVRVLGLTSLENAVDWAIREEVDFISMSLSFFHESFYDGTGPVSRLMNKLREHDIMMVTSAGNYARGHHRTTFEDANRDQFHDFADPRGLPIYFTSGRKSVQILWDDFRQCGWNDLNAYLWNRNGDLIAKSLLQQSPYIDGCHPSETITVELETDQWTFLTIENLGYGTPEIDVMARSGYVYESHRTDAIVDPGTHPSVLTVGAVRVDNYLQQGLEAFSSIGSTRQAIQKPEVVAPNGLDTLSYGSKGFFGTSASTPATVGTLALYKNKHPYLDNFTLTQQLIRQAIPDTPLSYEGSDTYSQYGRLRLPHPESLPTHCALSPLWFVGIAIFFFHKARR